MRNINRVLITGITGFVGSHLLEYLIANQPQVDIYGLIRWRSPMDYIYHIDKSKYNLVCGDLNDLGSLIRVLQDVQPDAIFHLAAQSYVQTSFKAPIDTLRTNVLGTANLLEAIHITNQNPIVHICSSSEVYGQVLPEEVPIKETCPFRPASPYAVSKVGEDMIAMQYYLSYKIPIIRTRMFTHCGPRRGYVFAESAFARQIALIEAGKQEHTIYVGNLDSVRTYADVRDTVRAYWLLVNMCAPGDVYNIGGDYTTSVGSMLHQLLLLSPAGSLVKIQVDQRLLRPSDVTLQVPDCSKFKNITGWQPEISFEQTMKDLLDYWRVNV